MPRALYSVGLGLLTRPCLRPSNLRGSELLHQSVVEHRGVDRFHQVGIDADLLGLRANLLAPKGRHHDDARPVLQPIVPPDDGAGLQSVHARHLPVHQDEL